MKIRGSPRDVPPEAYSNQVVEAIAERVRFLASTWDQTATPAPPEEELVEAVLGLSPLAQVDNELGDQVGPFYDTAGVMKVLDGVTKQAVAARRRKGTVLALRTADGMWVYPVFQFNGGGVDRSLLPAIRAFRDSPAWSAALWFVTGNDDLDGMSPLEWVKAGFPAAAVAASARLTAAEWV